MNHIYEMMNKADNEVYNSLLDHTAPGDPVTTDKNASPETSVMTTQLLMRIT